MDRTTFENLKKAISQERLAVYMMDGIDETTAIARYIYNIDLCKSLYPLINIFEVTLRNCIDSSLSAFFGTSDWNTVIPLLQSEMMMIEEAQL